VKSGEGAGRGPAGGGARLRHPLARFAALRAADGTRGAHFAAPGERDPCATRPAPGAASMNGPGYTGIGKRK